ncbi:MAG: hypothetical protein Q8L48_17085 [Archangium sp.]|nr:hypothetical protein [Archangium sp.]
MTLATVVLLLSSTVPSLSLDWRGLPDCPPRADFLQELRRLRGEVLEGTVEASDVAVLVTLERSGFQWRARVETRSRAGVGLRVLEADSCARAVEVAAVVVSLALADPPPTSPPAPPPVEPDVEQVERSGPVLPPIAPPPAPRWHFGLGLTGGGRAGLLPTIAPGGSVTGALSHGPWRLEAALSTPFSTRVVQGAVEAEVAVWLSGRVSGCFEVTSGRFSLGPCLLAYAAWLSGRGVGGLETATSGHAGYLGAAGGLIARARLVSQLWLRLDGCGGAALARPRFVTTSAASVNVLAASQPWLAEANFGVEWRFE